MNKLNIVSIVCSCLQIIGLFLIIFNTHLPDFIWIIIGITGFAAIVKIFLPDINDQKDLIKYPAALAGFGIIIISIFKFL